VTTVDGPRQSHQRGVRGIVYACSALDHIDCCGTRRSDSLLGLRNPPCSWTDMVDPSLPSFTIAPCVDSLLSYRIDQAA
jgi:hypothetical protein